MQTLLLIPFLAQEPSPQWPQIQVGQRHVYSFAIREDSNRTESWDCGRCVDVAIREEGGSRIGYRVIQSENPHGVSIVFFRALSDNVTTQLPVGSLMLTDPRFGFREDNFEPPQRNGPIVHRPLVARDKFLKERLTEQILVDESWIMDGAQWILQLESAEVEGQGHSPQVHIQYKLDTNTSWLREKSISIANHAGAGSVAYFRFGLESIEALERVNRDRAEVEYSRLFLVASSIRTRPLTAVLCAGVYGRQFGADTAAWDAIEQMSRIESTRFLGILQMADVPLERILLDGRLLRIAEKVVHGGYLAALGAGCGLGGSDMEEFINGIGKSADFPVHRLYSAAKAAWTRDAESRPDLFMRCGATVCKDEVKALIQQEVAANRSW